jgi:hypothetical protein
MEVGVEDTVTFGRRGVTSAALPDVSSKAPMRPPLRPGVNNPALVFLDRVFLWIPNENAPGFPAIGMALIRQTVLPFFLMLTPIVLLALINPSQFAQLRHTDSSWMLSGIMALVFGSVSLVQELSRYSFVRRADNPFRAILIFDTVTITFILLLFHNHIYTMAWMIALEVGASAAIYYVAQQRKDIIFVVSAVIISHASINIFAPQFFKMPATFEANTASSAMPITTSQAGQPSALEDGVSSSETPAVADLPSWAKVYPGAAIVENKFEPMFAGSKRWTIEYNASASPEEVDQFYQTTARAERFSSLSSLAGVRVFRQQDTGDSYFYKPDQTSPKTVHVTFIVTSMPR